MAEFTRTTSPDSKLDVVVGWVEDGAGATGGSGSTRVYVVPRGGKVKPSSQAAAEFHTDSDNGQLTAEWTSTHALEIRAKNFQLLRSQSRVTIGPSWVTIKINSESEEH